jgi:hypothetical protein
LLICAILVASAARHGDARAAQRAHGATHTRYAAELARRVAPAGDGVPLVMVSAGAADASHRRALEVRLRNTTQQAVSGFTWQWTWDDGQCPALTDIVAARGAYGGDAGQEPAVGPGAVVSVYVAPETVRDLLRTTRKRCHHGPVVRFTLTSVRYADGSQWTPAAAPSS